LKTKPDGQEKMWSGIPERRPVKKREKKELSFIILRFESHFEPAFPVIENHPKGFGDGMLPWMRNSLVIRVHQPVTLSLFPIFIETQSTKNPRTTHYVNKQFHSTSSNFFSVLNGFSF